MIVLNNNNEVLIMKWTDRGVVVDSRLRGQLLVGTIIRPI